MNGNLTLSLVCASVVAGTGWAILGPIGTLLGLAPLIVAADLEPRRPDPPRRR